MVSCTHYMPVSLPRDARSILKFRPEEAAEIERLTKAALNEHQWDASQDILFNLKSPLFWAYWIYKTERPITRAMRGTSIEQDLARFRRTRFSLLSQDAEVRETWALSAVGDLMCTRGLEDSRDRLYAEVEDLIFGADIAYANLESTLTTGAIAPLALRADESPMINLTPAQYETLTAHRGRRFDVVQLANNHILDCGLEGIETTLRRLRCDAIEQVGVNETAQAALEPRITEHRGLRIGWVAHTFSVNFKLFPTGEPWRVNMTPFHVVSEPDTSLLEEQIRRCRERRCDSVFVTLHWGLEFEFFPHPQQRTWAHRFAELGADLIIGHHPHVIQPVEIYRATDGREVPILYSLGNLTPVFSHPATALSLIARVRLARIGGSPDGEVRVAELELIPVALLSTVQGSQNGLGLCRLSDLQTTERGMQMQHYIADMNGYADRILGRGWRHPAEYGASDSI